MKILIVDDVLMVGRQLKHILEREKLFEVDVTDRAREALWKLEHDPTINVVITDLLMPEMNGFELAKEARRILLGQDQGTEKIPEFLLMTAVDKHSHNKSSDQALLLEAINSGIFSDILHKPICRKKLLECVFDLDLDEELVLDSVQTYGQSSPVIARIQKKFDRLLTTRDFVTLEALEQLLEYNLNNLKEKLNSL